MADQDTEAGAHAVLCVGAVYTFILTEKNTALCPWPVKPRDGQNEAVPGRMYAKRSAASFGSVRSTGRQLRRLLIGGSGGGAGHKALISM
jgi:hypothetical protein